MKKLFLFSLLSLTFLPVFAQNKMDAFWDLFKNNEYQSAIAELEGITAADPTHQEAWLMQAVLFDNQNESGKAFNAFKKFYALTDKKTEYLVAFWQTSAVYTGKPEERSQRAAFFQEVIADPAVDGAVKTAIYGTRASLALSQGDFAGQSAELAKIESLNKWQMVGEFENISASGFDKNFDPINEPKSSARFKNKQEAEIYWINSDVFRVGEWIHTGYHFSVGNSIIFAQTFINSEIDQDVELRIGTSGSLKAWVNDCLVLSEIEEYNNYADTYRSKINLKKGVNRLLLQLGSSEIDDQNFLVRLTDSKGNPLQNFTYNNVYENYPVVGGEKINKIELPAEVYFEEQVKNNPENLLNYILLSRVYLDNGKTNQAQVVLKKAEKLAPENSLILVELLNLYLGQGNDTELGAATEKLKSIEPENRLSILLEFSEALSNENYDEAEKILPRIKTAFGDDGFYLEKCISVESAKGNNQKVIDLINEGYSRFPNDATFVNYKYIVEVNVNQNPKAGQKVVKKFLKTHYSEDMQTLYAQSWIDRGNVPLFFEEYKKLLDRKPYSVGTIIDIADAYNQTGNYTEAIRYYDQAIALAPFVGSFYSKKGEVLMSMSRETEALTNFKKAIAYNPRDFDARQRIRDIEGITNPFENFAEKDFYEMYKNAPVAADYPEDNSVIISEDKQVVIHEKGAVEERNYLLVKVFDKAGVDFWKEYSISRNGSQYLIIEKAEVLKADGSKNVAETQGGYVVFTNLEPGDGIYLSYKLQNYYQGSLAEHYWGKEYFEYFVPAKNIEFSILYDPNEVPLKFQVANGEIDKTEKEVSEKKLITWSAKDVASVKSEGLMPPLADIGRTLHYSSIPDWKFVSDWYSDLAATKAKVDFGVDEAVANLFPDGHEQLTDAEKIRAIYAYIVNEIRYSSISFRQSGLVPQKASDVVTTKIGDCKDVSTLFVSMCEAVDIEAGLVLVNTRQNGQHAMELPSIEFNHCIAKTTLNGEERFVELTTDLYPFSTVSSSLEGSFILEIDKDKDAVSPRLLPRSTALPNAIYRQGMIQLGDSNMEVRKRCIKTGSHGGGMRASYRDDGEEARRKTMQEAISGDYANIKLDDLIFNESLESNIDSVQYEYSYTVTNPYTKIGSLQIVKLPLADAIEPIEFLSIENRKYDVELWKYFTYSTAYEEFTVEFPKGKKLAEKPVDVHISNGLVDYDLTFEMLGSTLRVTRKIHFKQSKILLEDFDLLKTTMEKIITADNLQIGFN